MSPEAVLVLGGRVPPGITRDPGSALGRRIAAAVEAAEARPEAWVVACGGRNWQGRVEADAIAGGVIAAGIARERVLRDRLSLTTLENLIEARRTLSRVGALDARWIIVTCDWHLPRALAIAEALGAQAAGHAARSPARGALLRTLQEHAFTWLDTHRARSLA